MAAPLFFRVFFSRAAVIAGAASLAVFALYREPDKLALLKSGATFSGAISFCETSLLISDAERLMCLQNFQQLRQFSDALAEELMSGTLDTCAARYAAGEVDKIWMCLRIADGSLAADKFKRPF
jgi:hypothetical protein